jgi:hypothetical protein
MAGSTVDIGIDVERRSTDLVTSDQVLLLIIDLHSTILALREKIAEQEGRIKELEDDKT